MRRKQLESEAASGWCLTWILVRGLSALGGNIAGQKSPQGAGGAEAAVEAEAGNVKAVPRTHPALEGHGYRPLIKHIHCSLHRRVGRHLGKAKLTSPPAFRHSRRVWCPLRQLSMEGCGFRQLDTSLH